MTKIKIFFAFLLLGIASVTAHAGIFSDTWHYKMSVTVETPEGDVTGSVVREAMRYTAFNLTLKWVDRYRACGEAVVVDLGKRGVLFGLTRGPLGRIDHYIDVFVDSLPTLKYGGKVSLTPIQYPKFITYTDLDDPRTVQQVIEIEGTHQVGRYLVKADHTEELFGEGVKIKSVMIEQTDEPLTHKLSFFVSSVMNDARYREWLKQLKYGDPRVVLASDFMVKCQHDH